MPRRFFVSVLVLFLLASSVLAQEASSEIAAWVCPEGYSGQTLSVFNWSTYIGESTIADFENACDVSVNYDIFENNETMVARIRQGNPGYDVIVPSDSFVQIMAREGLLIPLNKDLIPNIANLNENFLNPVYDPENVYSVPYLWASIGVGYNTEVFPDGISSWDEVWAYDGSVAWLDERRGMLGIALNILGFDPNSEDEEELAQARDYLIERSGNLVVIAVDDGQVYLERGDVNIAIEWNGDILALADSCECDTYGFVVPSEGSQLVVDNLAVPIDAPNEDLAMVFIDYLLHPQVAADIANFTAYATPNQAALDAELIEEADNPLIYPSEDALEKMFVVQTVSEDSEELYNNMWDEMLIFIGQ